ncbi:YesL family protein [Gracilibacillus salinarum]|uniref:YesL family protein n=1 Tax=Gracilibacillus salinarum TaxID=2932255 RepID=A0ABY4GPW5_9BACI|nr:YesL family protein [Gracilibacillus salinarum]UOQ86395.1 YesL family protein [Gracilibacillus salinarum]
MLGNGFISKFYFFGETVLLLLYVNFLWVCFTLAGAVIFGFGPSTVAMFTIFRRWSQGEEDIPAFKVFWQTYKKEFIRANKLGIFILLFAYMLYINFHFLQIDNAAMQQVMEKVLLFVSAVLGLMVIYIFPMYVHYDNKLYNYVKNAILLTVYSPVRTIYLVSACLTLYYLYFKLPVFLFFFGASLSSLVIMWIAHRTFLRLEIKQELLQET